MLKRWNWPLIGFFAVAAAIPVAAFVYEYVFMRCSASMLSEVMKDKPEFGCFEFWLSRHQTNLQTMVTALLTATGLYFVVRQLRELTTQNRLTAAALDGTRKEQAANRRMVVARAVAGVQAYAAVATTLMIELGRQMGGRAKPRKSDEFGDLKSLSEANISVYPVLITPELRQHWRSIRDRFNAVMTFTMLNDNSVVMDAYQSDDGADVKLPADHHAAVLEIATVIGLLRGMTQYLEGTAPDD